MPSEACSRATRSATACPIWPFADPVDRAENVLLTQVVQTLRDQAPLPGDSTQVLQRTESYGRVFWTLKFKVDGVDRCREVAVGLNVSSRRVSC